VEYAMLAKVKADARTTFGRVMQRFREQEL